MTVHLGFSCSQHDPSVAVVDDGGVVLFAQANERTLKQKRGWHAPSDAFGVIEPILDRYVGDAPVQANLTWSRGSLASVPVFAGVSRMAVAALEFLRPVDEEGELWRAWMLRHALYRAPRSVSDHLLNLEFRLRERRGFRHRFPKRTWNHHLCHAVTACLSSPYDDALCVVVDGMGEGSSTAIYRFRDEKLKRLDGSVRPNLASLGHFYSQACFVAGFDPQAGEEWKLMGLAAYGSLDEDLQRTLRGALSVGDCKLTRNPEYATAFERLMPFRSRGHMANADLAFTVQKVFEDVLFEFLGRAHRKWGGDNLVLTGGCALNSSAIGKVLAYTPFRRLHVTMAPGDDGNSVGAALLGWQAANPGRKPPRLTSPYLGSEIEPDTLRRMCRQGLAPILAAASDEQLTDFLAKEIATGAVVGLVRGRAEFGSRALGARSILADPRSPGIRDRINADVKFREDFRPFAPSILHERGAEYFEDYAASPYMERTLRWRVGKAPPGVCHVDGTGRLQSVTKDANPFFHELISAFERETGLPVLLNTSFNVMGRPMVHDVEDAIGVFLTSGIDLLVIGDAVFRKPHDATAW